jgi:hypothetical protein
MEGISITRLWVTPPIGQLELKQLHTSTTNHLITSASTT